ncbi:MAG: peptidoglycan editing factor PgeF [Burkholderiales bacterium]
MMNGVEQTTSDRLVHEFCLVPQWPASPRIRALITTRQGGVSTGEYASMNLGDHVGDKSEAYRENRCRLRLHLPDEPLWLRQVHGTRVIEASDWYTGVEADAVVARAASRVLAVLSADCLPVLFCDLDATTVAVAHAGWRGLASGVIEATVAKMALDPARILAYLGPGIGTEAYEVGEEVRAAFVNIDSCAAPAFTARGDGKFLCDLALLARQRLAKTGIMSIHGGGYCTYAEKQRFFSYRRDGPTGRMASLVWIAT